ncbi:right-handed parallel beta-helix repeat-containing protein [Methanolobus sp. WCC4]|uniref:right-handed parallel beta-helix repeat-containing protein n=1 Tax=Methanolobus sp. WCC4 TaxID=3125784 RepID=UPI0030F6A8FE
MGLKIITVIFLLLLTISCASATTITFSNNDSINASFTSIQDAIDQAQKNDSIVIYSGTYSETLVVDKPLSISSFSPDPKDVVITSNNSSAPIIHITADNVKVSGLTIEGDSDNPVVAGIAIGNVKNSLVSNNIISKTQNGLYIESSSGNEIQNNTMLSNTEHGIYLLDSGLNTLENNIIQSNKRGLYLDISDENIITGNEINNNQFYGLALRKSNTNEITNNQLFLNSIGLSLTSSDKNSITGNNVSNNKDQGSLLWDSGSNTLKSNVLAENRDSGITLISSTSANNVLDGNTLSNNFHGISIENSDNNIIKNNAFNSNEEYGIYHLFPGDKNTIEDNSFSDNRSENIEFTIFQQIFIFFVILIVATVIAFYFNLSWLKKGIAGLVVLLVITFILIIAWYYPFSHGLPDNNVYVENLEESIVPLNETYSRVTISMNLNYQNKDAYLYNNNTGDMIDNLPVFVQVSASTPADGSYSDEDTELIFEEQVVLEYLGSNHYECTIDMESGKTYAYDVEVKLRRELPYPHPTSGEIKWELLGGLSDNIDLR